MIPLKLVHRRTETADIESFFFEPEAPITWLAGQSLKLEVPTVYGPSEHRFSIASAPSEKHVMVTTRLSGSIYKTGLASLKAGDAVRGGAVEGDFVWQNQSEEPVVLIAAGIGITPFRSILTERHLNQQPTNATLIIGVRGDQPIYHAELNQLQQNNPGLNIIYRLGERLDIGFVSQHLPTTNGLLYLSGPSAMVDELSLQLAGHGIAPEKIRHDWFAGRIDY